MISYNTRPLVLVYIILAIWVLFAGLAELFVGGGRWGLLSIGSACLLASLLPVVVRKRVTVFEPIVLVAFSVFMGCALRAVLVATGDQSSEDIVFLTNGVSLGEIATYSIFAAFGLLVFSLGYLSVGTARFALERASVFNRRNWNQRWLLGICFATLGIGLAGLVELIRATNVDLGNLAALSVKRGIEVEGGGEQDFARLGYLAWAVELVKVAFIVLLVERTDRARSGSISNGTTAFSLRLFLLLLFLISIIWPFMSSSRTGILEVLFACVIVFYYLGFKGGTIVRKHKFFVLGSTFFIVGIIVLVAIGIWRQYSHDPATADKSFADALLGNTVGAGNFVPLIRTGIIAEHAFSSETKLLLGESYASVFYAPVPRSVWPEKPMIGLGYYVKEEVFDRRAIRGGYPPGFIGEALINFGLVGLVIIPFLGGAGLRVLFNSFEPLLAARNKAGVAVYSLLLWPLGFQFADLDFSLTVINSMVLLIPAITFIRLVARRN
ncbi:O-antigen polymerase [Algiphilus sp.]|uniref:O-antigen polymerase n=1 Tax=Algiphilus sp. TaxID=1872431 RepID=UPI003C7E36D9